jgi:hypothetical protein
MILQHEEAVGQQLGGQVGCPTVCSVPRSELPNSRIPEFPNPRPLAVLEHPEFPNSCIPEFYTLSRS